MLADLHKHKWLEEKASSMCLFSEEMRGGVEAKTENFESIPYKAKNLDKY